MTPHHRKHLELAKCQTHVWIWRHRTKQSAREIAYRSRRTPYWENGAKLVLSQLDHCDIGTILLVVPIFFWAVKLGLVTGCQKLLKIRTHMKIKIWIKKHTLNILGSLNLALFRVVITFFFSTPGKYIETWLILLERYQKMTIGIFPYHKR